MHLSSFLVLLLHLLLTHQHFLHYCLFFADRYACVEPAGADSVVIVKYYPHGKAIAGGGAGAGGGKGSKSNAASSSSSAAASVSFSSAITGPSMWLNGPPAAPYNFSSYRTVGAVDSLASHILARYACPTFFILSSSHTFN